MRVRLSVAIAAVLYGSLALADGQRLGDASLDGVTAGTAQASDAIASGGAVVGNDSDAKIKITGSLNLSGEAQSGASGLNVVNGSESTVANGVNVWDGQLKDALPAAGSGRFEINQSNAVEQEQRRVAFLPDYSRSEANVSKTWKKSGTSDGKDASNQASEVRDLTKTGTTRALTSEGSVNTETTVAGQQIRGGRGIAGAGDLHVKFDGGAIGLGIEGDIADVLKGKLTLNVDLPNLDIDFNGGGCAVQMGSCTGKGSLDESSTNETDKGTTTTLVKSSEAHGTYADEGTEDTRSPFSVRGAQAEYIVVDGSTLEVDSNYGVAITGSAQKNLRALNAVNSAGSAVANAVNISRTPSFTSGQTLALNQQNVIRHSR